MKALHVETMTLGAFVKLSATAGAAFGLLVGIIGLIGGLIGADVYIILEPFPRLTGLAAGLVGLPLMPLVFSILGAAAALLLYLPFNLFLRMAGGVYLNGRWQ